MLTARVPGFLIINPRAGDERPSGDELPRRRLSAAGRDAHPPGGRGRERDRALGA